MKHVKHELTNKEVDEILQDRGENIKYQKLRDALLLLTSYGIITNVEYIRLCERVMLTERKDERIYPVNNEEGD
jgi:Fe2+ or Zn2+ uptake regulation protein